MQGRKKTKIKPEVKPKGAYAPTPPTVAVSEKLITASLVKKVDKAVIVHIQLSL